MRDEDIFDRLFVGVDAVGQDDFGHLRTHVDGFDDVAVHVDVLKGGLGDASPHVALAVFVHGVTSGEFHFGRTVVCIALGDFDGRMGLIRTIVEGNFPRLPFQITQHAGQPSWDVYGEFGGWKGPMKKTFVVQGQFQFVEVGFVHLRDAGLDLLKQTSYHIFQGHVSTRSQIR